MSNFSLIPVCRGMLDEGEGTPGLGMVDLRVSVGSLGSLSLFWLFLVFCVFWTAGTTRVGDGTKGVDFVTVPVSKS